ncbi:uncharacterized protein METZ01_LOCUS228699, partial [marine metagenome]
MIPKTFLSLCLVLGVSAEACAAPASWQQSYDAGY